MRSSITDSVIVTTVPFSEPDATPRELLADAGIALSVNPLGRRLQADEVAGAIGDHAVVIAGTEPITAAVMAACPNLRAICRVGIGLDSVDLTEARNRGIEVSYTPDAPSGAVAELTIGLMIDVARGASEADRAIRGGTWQRTLGRRLGASIIGVVGVGRIGSRVIRHLLGGFPGVRVNVGQPIAMSVDELLTGTKAQLAVKIFGPDTEVLLEGSQDLQSILQEIPGATDVQADQITGAPQLVVSLNRPALGRYGLSVEEALDALRSGVGGAEAGAVFEGVRQFPVIVRYAEEDRNTPAAIGRTLAGHKAEGRFPAYPYGSDFTEIERTLTGALKGLRGGFSTRRLLRLARHARRLTRLPAAARPYLARMELAAPRGWREALYARLVVLALLDAGAITAEADEGRSRDKG